MGCRDACAQPRSVRPLRLPESGAGADRRSAAKGTLSAGRSYLSTKYSTTATAMMTTTPTTTSTTPSPRFSSGDGSAFGVTDPGGCEGCMTTDTLCIARVKALGPAFPTGEGRGGPGAGGPGAGAPL